MIRTVSLADVPETPWRNGGGVTQELLAWPQVAAAADVADPADPAQPANLAEWQVRISVARIDRDGPFSAYPGVERWFAVVAGEGVVLRFDNRRALLTAGSEPVRFEGAAAPGCDLLDGATQDLNLMVRSAAGSGGLFSVEADHEWASTAPLRAVFTAAAAKLQIDGTDAAVLPAGTLAWSEDAREQRWRLFSPGSPPRAWWLQFKPRAP